MLLDTVAAMSLNGLVFYAAAGLIRQQGTELMTGAGGLLFAISPFAVLQQLAYLVSWTLVGHNDAPIAYHLGLSLDERRDVLRSLDTATITEIVEAIKQHEAAAELALTEKKTIPEPVLAS